MHESYSKEAYAILMDRACETLVGYSRAVEQVIAGRGHYKRFKEHLELVSGIALSSIAELGGLPVMPRRL